MNGYMRISMAIAFFVIPSVNGMDFLRRLFNPPTPESDRTYVQNQATYYGDVLAALEQTPAEVINLLCRKRAHEHHEVEPELLHVDDRLDKAIKELEAVRARNLIADDGALVAFIGRLEQLQGFVREQELYRMQRKQEDIKRHQEELLQDLLHCADRLNATVESVDRRVLALTRRVDGIETRVARFEGLPPQHSSSAYDPYARM